MAFYRKYNKDVDIAILKLAYYHYLVGPVDNYNEPDTIALRFKKQNTQLFHFLKKHGDLKGKYIDINVYDVTGKQIKKNCIESNKQVILEKFDIEIQQNQEAGQQAVIQQQNQQPIQPQNELIAQQQNQEVQLIQENYEQIAQPQPNTTIQDRKIIQQTNSLSVQEENKQQQNQQQSNNLERGFETVGKPQPQTKKQYNKKTAIVKEKNNDKHQQNCLMLKSKQKNKGKWLQ